MKKYAALLENYKTCDTDREVLRYSNAVSLQSISFFYLSRLTVWADGQKNEQGLLGRNESLLKILTQRPRPGKVGDTEGDQLVAFMAAHHDTLDEVIDVLRPLREENEHLQRECIRTMIDREMGLTEREAMRSLVAGATSSEVLTRVESRLKEVKDKLVRPIDRLAKTTGLVTKGLVEANNELRVQLAQERAFIQLAQKEADRR